MRFTQSSSCRSAIMQQRVRDFIKRRKAEAEARGIVYISSEERAAMEQEEQGRKAEEKRIEELHERCRKKGLNFDEEEAKYQKKLADKKAKEEAKRKKKESRKKESRKKERQKSLNESKDRRIIWRVKLFVIIGSFAGQARVPIRKSVCPMTL